MKTVFRIVLIMTLLYSGMRWYARTTEKNIDEALPVDAGKALRVGTFAGTNSAGDSRGSVSEYSVHGRRFLHFENFFVTNAPGLRVFLSESGVTASSSMMIAKLKGNSGNQNYDIPPEAALRVLDTVVIQSKLLGTVYAKATLK